MEKAREKFQEIDRELFHLERKALRSQLANQPVTVGNREGYPRDKTELGLIEHERGKQRKHIPLRDLLARAGQAVQDLKPCFMMGPFSVAQYLKPGGLEFDLVVIDEASQMRPEDALGALVRSGQIVVVGDPKQLPPSSFFSRAVDEGDEEEQEETDTESVESILDLAMRCWQPYRRLLWHYRSRHGSLIAFSNCHFYNNELIVFPSPATDNSDCGVQLEPVEGIYRKGGINEIEARRVAEEAIRFMVAEMASDAEMRSLGIVAMNQKQSELIQDEVDRLVQDSHEAERYINHFEQEAEGLNSFFVKNLENVQGDERDAIFISATYGPDQESGKVHQRFGPINSQSGPRRLNVLFTRAKQQVRLFSSMSASDIQVNDTARQTGRQVLRDYLRYAETGELPSGAQSNGEPDSDFEVFVRRRLEARGFQVDHQIGVSGYFIDLGVRDPAFPDTYIVGVECDGAAYHSAKSARDRDRLRQQVLENLGWTIYRIWSTDWFADPEGETDKLERFLQKILKTKAPMNN
jgi:superfamily I DNA and/or RNA helicase/very-short-patch-repair endonuclease